MRFSATRKGSTANITPVSSSITASGAAGAAVNVVPMAPPRNQESIQPPRKVIRALYDYNAEGADELSFRAGDFFHVVGDEDDEYWYEAYNPLTKQRGLVPVAFFQSIERRAPSTLQPVSSGAQGINGGSGGSPVQVPAKAVASSSSLSGPSGYSPNMGALPPSAQQQQQHHAQIPQPSSGYVGQSPAVRSMSSTSHMYSPISSTSNINAAGAPSAAASQRTINSTGGGGGSYDPRRSSRTFTSAVSASGGPGGAKPHENVYGIVLFDFTAERPDELSAKSGEPIIIIAQSDHEWYVAKPIGRLGGPGLIPIAYVEVRDVQTGQAVDDLGEMLRRNNIKLMGVEEWRMHTLSQLKQNEQPAASSGANILHSTDVSAAGVSNFISRDGVYFFKVEISLIDGRHRVLYRQYEDFYDFQIALLNQFPRESGRTGERRTLPFMPGPAAFVNEMVTMQRKLDLDKYIQDMFRQPNYIVDAEPFQSFLSIRGDDTETMGIPTDDFSTSNSNSNNNNNASAQYSSALPASSQQQSQRTPSGQLSQIPPHQTPSASTSQSRITSQQQSQQQTVIKAKIMFQDDILAMKLPVNLTYGMLCEKIGQRLGLNQIASISYRDSSGNFVHLGDDVDLERALDSDPFRIMLSVMPM